MTTSTTSQDASIITAVLADIRERDAQVAVHPLLAAVAKARGYSAQHAEFGTVALWLERVRKQHEGEPLAQDQLVATVSLLSVAGAFHVGANQTGADACEGEAE